jgi:hypothetical protein
MVSWIPYKIQRRRASTFSVSSAAPTSSGWTCLRSARRPRKAAPRGRPRGRFAVFGETEVHLLLEAVHLGHLHGHLVAEADDAAGAAAREIIARGVVISTLVILVLYGGMSLLILCR